MLPATLGLIGISVLVFLLMLYPHSDMTVRALLISEYSNSGLLEVRNGQWWRLVTPIFLHFGIFHLVFNLLWTWELGRVIEVRHGALVLLGMTAVISVLSNVAQYYVTGPVFGGMSGIIYGYFGYLWVRGLLARPIVYLLLGWFMLGWSGIFTLFNVHIANTAHTGGLLAGIMLAVLCIIMRKVKSELQP